jgi:hypothetical protein
MRWVRPLACVLVLAATAACASNGSGGAGERRRSSELTQDEIRGSHANTVHELVQALRPGWLRVRGTTSLQEQGAVVVYINNVRSGTPEVLRQVRPDAVESIRYLDELQASSRYGTGHAHGVIEVTLIAGH